MSGSSFNFGQNKNLLRELSRLKVLKDIWKYEPISRADLSKRTGLSKATVGLLIKELIKNKVIKEIGYGNSSREGGKKPILLEFEKDNNYIIGVSIGYYKVKIALGNIKAEFIKKIEIKRELSEEAEKTINNIIKAIKEINYISPDKILGIGIGIPGMLDHNKGIVKFSPNLNWKNVHIKKMIEKEIKDIKCFIDQEAYLQILALNWYGQEIQSRNLIAVEAGVGLGMGLFIDNKLYRGNNEASGEFGHTTLLVNGEECHCGNYGCWETLASTRVVIRKAINGMKNGRKTLISEYKINGEVEFESIINSYNAGDEFAKELLEEYAYWLGIGIANIVNVFDPEVVVIYGQAPALKEMGLRIISKIVKQRALPRLERNIDIRYSTLGKDAKLIGTFGIVIKNIIEIPEDFLM